MIPTLAVREQMAKLLAADPTTLAPAGAANKIVLIKAPFTPSENTDIGTLAVADFDGSTPIAGATGTQPESLDPNTLDSLIDISPPLGGYRWETTGITNLPQTIYGYALVDDAGTSLLASELLPVPVNLTGVNQSLVLPRTYLRQLAGSVQ